MKFIIFIVFISGCNYGNFKYQCPDTQSRWANLPIHLNPDSDYPYLVDSTYRSADLWNKSIGIEVFIVDGTGVYIGIGKVSKSTIQATTHLEFINSVTSVSGHIYFNENQHPDTDSVMIHELGHVLGLKHSDDGQGGTMSTYLAVNSIRRFVDKWSYDRVMCLYRGDKL